MHILHLVGARPNFIKVAPVWLSAAEQAMFRQTMVHTGQHYDVTMSDVLFSDLGIPVPNHFLGVGSGSHAQQTAAIMISVEKVLLEIQPDLVLVYGDVNSTVAAALVCAKLSVPVAHVEAGLRSFDRNMPEEINRVVTDQIADLLFTPSVDGNENLVREGVAKEKIYLVGNVMIDSLLRLLLRVRERGSKVVRQGGSYALVTLHRPSNVDDPNMLIKIMKTLEEISKDVPVIFPIHPRTRLSLQNLGFKNQNPKLQLLDPLGYLDFLAIQRKATVVITDSGGIQEETSFLGVRCLTVREKRSAQ